LGEWQTVQSVGVEWSGGVRLGHYGEGWKVGGGCEGVEGSFFIGFGR